MPIYEYTCGGCGARFEALRGMSSDAPACPTCGATRARRNISLFAAGGGSHEVATGCGCGGACACGGR